MIRCFVAVDIDSSVREKIRGLQEEWQALNAPVRCTNPAGIHVTLKFLGHISEDILGRVRESLAAVSAARATFRVSCLGAFPNLKQPRVFWAGIGPQKVLDPLQASVEEALVWMNIREDRPFHPHLTLARSKERKGLDPLIGYIKIHRERFDAGHVQASEFHLYQSLPKGTGAHYVKLASFPLK
ncbi:MAG TPA: RNA 2',3'-cyclic phosphodiesterase [Acidobacteriota bacterium]|jgi:2'-5' RNA ligase